MEDVDSINETIANNLKIFMEKNGLTAYRIAKDLNLKNPTIARFLNRQIYEVKFSYLWAISKYYDVPFEYFLGNGKDIPAVSNDKTTNMILEFTKEFLSNAPDDTKTWFHEQFKRSFSDYREWLEKRENKKSKNTQVV